MSLVSKIESLLFVAGKPLSFKKMADLLAAKETDAEEAVKIVKEKYNRKESGLQLMQSGKEVQFVTNPENSRLVRGYLKDEASGELTRPSLETLAIVAYRGPVAKMELEQIRGVNCSLILRNLLMRGLIEEREDKNLGQKVYKTTFDFLRFLGVREESELPDYEKLSRHELLDKAIEAMKESG